MVTAQAQRDSLDAADGDSTFHRLILDALDQLDDPVVIFDKNWCYLFVNKVGWEVLNRPKSEVLGNNVWELLPQLKGSEYQKAARQAMRTQQNKQIEEYYPYAQQWYTTKFYPLPNALVAQMKDITELKETRRINDQLHGSLAEAMEVYWSDENKKRRRQQAS